LEANCVFTAGADENSSTYQEIEPQCDQQVFFPAWFPHEVLPVHCGSAAFEDMGGSRSAVAQEFGRR
jgi:hypothetical protein